MKFFKREKKIPPVRKKWKITQKCLKLILEASKSNYPREFGGLLRVDKIAKDTIYEVMILPGTVSGDAHAIFKLHMLPIDYSIVGTVHSHPSPFVIPSEADLSLFDRFGKIHIIVASPFNENSWRAYNYMGKELEIDII